MGDTEPVDEGTRLTEKDEKKLEAEKEHAATADAGDAPETDDPKVKFVNDKKEVKVDIDGNLATENAEFRGLTKDELMKFANDPFWIRVRYGLLIAFWVIWFGMLIAAVLIIVFTPKCPPRPNLHWWQKSVIYDIYPRSFYDTNGDGVGDIKGIHEKIDYLMEDVNASALIIGPIYQSPQKDFGYDVSDHKSIDEIFGSLEDFDDLRVTLHKKNVRIILDFIPNHTSRNHTWFVESRKSKDNDYADYYVWRDGKNGGPPNNWKSVYGGSAWTLDNERGQYYLHQFLPEEPDLNLENSKVVQALDDILMFWLKERVDGFRLRAAAHLAEDGNFEDEPANDDWTTEPNDYNSLLHNKTTFQPKTYELIKHWNEMLKKYSSDEGRQHARFLLVEASGSDEEMKPFYNEEKSMMPYDNKLVKLEAGCKAKCLEKLIQDARKTADKQWQNWVMGSDGSSRIATRLNQDWSTAISLLQLTLPGTPVLYYGNEIGMHDVEIPFNETKDPLGIKYGETDYKTYSRDPYRTPMQWNNEENAGFTSGQPWLPVARDYLYRNVMAQKALGGSLPELKVIGNIAGLHSEPSLLWGEYHDSSSGQVPNDDNLLSYIRKAEGFPGYLIAINFGDQAVTTTFYTAAKDSLITPTAILRGHTANFDSHKLLRDFEIGSVVDLQQAILLEPSEGVILEFVKKE